MKNNLIYSLCLLLLFVSCKKNTENNITVQPVKPGYDREAMLKSISEKVFATQSAQFNDASENLKIAAQNFTTSLDTSSLHALQRSWKKNMEYWSEVELYKVGYALNNNLHTQLNEWPTNISLVESEISGTNTITESYIQLTGTSRKGLPAIEYLIFDADTTIIRKFTSDPTAARRKLYLVALCAHVNTHASALNDYWESEINRIEFYSNAGIQVSGNTSVLFNSILSLCEVMRDRKTGVPLGKKANNVIQPLLVQSRYAHFNREEIAANLKSLKALIKGHVFDNNAIGFDDYLDFLETNSNDKLCTRVLNQIVTCEQDLAALQDDIHEGLSTENTAVTQLYDDLGILLSLLKVDVASRLSIAVTFSDNDGD